MYLNFLKSKLHRATVTEANLNYVGSITIDEALLEAANIYPNEKVQVVNNNNGARLETYVIQGERNSGIICLNGAAARLVQPGDHVIIIAYCLIREDKVNTFKPKIVILGENNEIVALKDEEIHGTTKHL
ncbi:aspartate 1-decarboxylase [Clostridium formicaceticum]|uniref:Aspartate 1-decarboxylase n=1 Tax=Clostridium formicaceticum TaxID=1497 RepID=A0AAC9WH71_9CLOT|nr:aspartate 1-decarboxylase [Clostridium formicaceticum]AOY78002.1 aspartate 1-decarboxylase [Clostridium formicaceticum]ARE88633.1 Aspartate 1-decarboxylase precursor [Clostridium formicaceticum]